MMPNKGRMWFSVLALSAGIALSSGPVYADAAPRIEANSLSGAYLAGRVAEADNDLDAAVAYYQRALVFDPDNRDIQQNLMLALIARGSFEEALPYAEKLKSVPEIERFSRLALAVDAFRKKDYSRAQYWLKLSLESDLDKLITGLMTAWAKEGEGHTTEALAYLKKLNGPDWYTLFVSYHRALIADVGGHKKEAEDAYKATLDNIAAGGAAPGTYMRAAEAYAGFLARNGQKVKALGVLNKADAFASGRLPIIALRKKIEKGTPVERLVASPTDGAAEVLLDLGTALNRGGGEQFVRLYLQYALALKPDSDLTLLQLGVVAEQQQNPREAIKFYARIPDTSPLKRLSELQTGLNLADLNENDEAIKHLKNVLASDPGDMRAYLALGGVYSAKKDYRSAAELYDKAVARLNPPKPADWNIFYQRGIAYERLKEWPKAEPNFKEALKLQPDQPQVLNYLGYSWVDMNINLDQALDMIRKAVGLRPSDGYIVDSLGWAYYKLGRYDEAVTQLERAVSLKPDDPVLNDHLGDAYWRVGRKLEATYQWRQAKDMKPDPDVLADIEKKLVSGLPPVEPKKAAQAPDNARKAPPKDDKGGDQKG